MEIYIQVAIFNAAAILHWRMHTKSRSNWEGATTQFSGSIIVNLSA